MNNQVQGGFDILGTKPILSVDRLPHSYTDPNWQLTLGLQYGYSCTPLLPTPGAHE